MLDRLIESAIQNFSLTDLLVFSSLFVFLYNTFGLKQKVSRQRGDIDKFEATQDALNQKLNQTVKPDVPEFENNSTIKILVAVTESFYKYGLISLGKNSDITKHLQPGKAISVIYDENEYQGKVHSSVAGRIDGLTKMYKENLELKAKTSMEINYLLGQNKIIIF